MKDMIVGSTIISQDMLESPRGKMDECISLIIGNRLVNIDDPQKKPNQRESPKNQIDVGGIFFAKKNVVKCGANRLGWIWFV